MAKMEADFDRNKLSIIFNMFNPKNLEVIFWLRFCLPDQASLEAAYDHNSMNTEEKNI